MPDERQASARPSKATSPRDLLTPLLLFAAARAVSWSAAWVAWFVNRGRPFGRQLSNWDGEWYVRIVTEGYPSAVPTGSGDAAQSALAFFPAYPAVVRLADALTPLGPRGAGVLVNAVFGALATVLFWVLARSVADARGDDDATAVANRATAVFAFFPGTFVLGMVYSEGLFLAAAIACLLLLNSGRWPVAGLACAVATATRPTGLAVLAACAVAAGVAIVRRRDMRALTAPVIGASGLVAWLVYVQAHTGDLLAWRKAQERGWGQRLDFGRFFADRVEAFVQHPLADFNGLGTVVMAAFVLVATALWVVGRWRPPAALAVYTVGIIAPVVLSQNLDLTARFTMTAFPLFIAVGRMARGSVAAATVGIGAGALAIVTIVAGAMSYTP